MPADLILHERNALALDGVCKDGLGLAGHGRLGKRGLDGVEIVAVGQLDEVKAERAELGGEIAEAHDLIVRAVDLKVVTDLGIMKFDEETKRMYLAYYYPFSSPEMVQENTGFEIDVSRAELMEGPSPEIIRLIREEIDPGQAFIKVPKDK